MKPWRLPLLLSGGALFSQAFPLPSPITDVVTEQPAVGYTLHFPFWNLVFTPFCSLADRLTVFSLKEGMVFLVYLFLLLFLWKGWRRRLMYGMGVLLFLAWGALVPRPMGCLEAADPDILLIDFHSHTHVSHDGRKSFTPHANEEWHRRQGYGAGFITDHNRVEASQQAKEETRRTWEATGYHSLEGEEASLYKTHLVLLGTHERVDNHPYDSDTAKIQSFVRDMHRKGIPVIASLPEYWFYHWGEGVHDFIAWGMDGFELINSAPKALDFPISYRREIIQLCREKNLIVTGISDNHGYGYATAVWNAMRLPGWQKMDPDQLEKAVLKNLKEKRFSAVQVLERIRFHPENRLELGMSPLFNTFLYWRSLQGPQALSWVGWIWALSFWRRKNG